MKETKKTLCGLLAFALVFGLLLAGCDSGNGSNPDDSNSGNSIVGTWTGTEYDGEPLTLILNANLSCTLTYGWGSAPPISGTYTVTNNTITFFVQGETQTGTIDGSRIYILYIIFVKIGNETGGPGSGGGPGNGGNPGDGQNPGPGGSDPGGDQNPSGTLPAPTNLTVTGRGPTWITLSWSAVSGAEGYIVYWSSNPSGPYNRFFLEFNTYSVIGYRNLTSDVATELTPNTTYYVKVSSSNSSTGPGPQSEYISAQTGARINWPRIVSGSTTSTDRRITSVTINWTAVPGATGYFVYNGGSNIGTTSSNTFTHIWQEEGVIIALSSYYVMAYDDNGGESFLSNRLLVRGDNDLIIFEHRLQ